VNKSKFFVGVLDDNVVAMNYSRTSRGCFLLLNYIAENGKIKLTPRGRLNRETARWAFNLFNPPKLPKGLARAIEDVRREEDIYELTECRKLLLSAGLVRQEDRYLMPANDNRPSPAQFFSQLAQPSVVQIFDDCDAVFQRLGFLPSAIFWQALMNGKSINKAVQLVTGGKRTLIGQQSVQSTIIVPQFLRPLTRKGILERGTEKESDKYSPTALWHAFILPPSN